MKRRVAVISLLLLLVAPSSKPSARDMAAELDEVITDLEDVRDRLESVADDDDAFERRDATLDARFKAKSAAIQLLLMSARTNDELKRVQAAIKLVAPELSPRSKQKRRNN